VIRLKTSHTCGGSFTFKEDESDELAIGETAMASLLSRGLSCVVGKLLADRVVSKETIKTPLIRAWQPSGRGSFKNLGVNLFRIEFEYE
jgi:predicted molibdopterin-dependent oxidoreductase YjgC